MDNDKLFLRGALELWCEPAIVERVKSAERDLTEDDFLGRTPPLNRIERIQLTPPSERRPPNTARRVVEGLRFRQLDAAWDDLRRDLRDRITKQKIHLQGVQVAPERRVEPELIPSGWAADFVFDFARGAINVAKYRYTAVVCSLSSWIAAQPPAASISSTAAELKTLRPEDVPDLDNDTLLLLLNEHLRRVIGGGTKLIAPGKVSLVPLILGKMKARAANGELEATQAAESRWLHAWLKEAVPNWQTPGAATIAQKIKAEHKKLKATFTPNIQNSIV